MLCCKCGFSYSLGYFFSCTISLVICTLFINIYTIKLVVYAIFSSTISLVICTLFINLFT
ncbi:hypothetical protein Hanom_Chr14g01321661 [Helianthus anomalus]